MTKVHIDKLVRRYGALTVLNEVSLDVQDGEFIVLLGPSGCGKSTLLSAIAGLDDVQGGRIWFDERDVTTLEPSQREIGMVFQSYALYPTMTVRANMAFALRVSRTSRAEIEERVTWAAQLLQIEHLLDRKPGQLSGGQRQRVAIGRALVRRARIFLFDEPLSNLDAKLRTEMRNEIKSLHQRLGVTFIFVTHDQIEAMTLATRIAVMNAGIIQQIGTPDDLYRRPATQFVADFVGLPAMTFLDATLQEPVDGAPVVQIGQQSARLDGYVFGPDGADRRGPVTLGIRPERVEIGNGHVPDRLCARRTGLEPHGADTLVQLDLRGQPLTARVSPEIAKALPDDVHVTFDIEGVSLFDPDSGNRI